MTEEETTPVSLRPAPDGLIIFGASLGLCGYLLPWFRMQSGYAWSFSGLEYASLSSGGGWTLFTFAWLAVALIAGMWARASMGAAITAIVGAVGALMFALVVVAASFAEFREQGSINWIAELPFGVGLPVMAAGFGVLLAAGVRAIARITVATAIAAHPAGTARSAGTGRSTGAARSTGTEHSADTARPTGTGPSAGAEREG